MFIENSTWLPCDRNVTLQGFRQSYKYFDKYKSDIKSEFTFQENISKRCDKAFSDAIHHLNANLSHRNCFWVGAHMRRGDFVFDTYQHKGYIPAESEYLRRAIKYFENRFRKRYGCIRFLILGNDRQWNYMNSPKKYNVLVLDSNTPEVDMCVLSRCNGTILSSGSFGWWGAYLADGPTTYMQNQCRPNSSLCSEIQIKDYINPDWDWTPL